MSEHRSPRLLQPEVVIRHLVFLKCIGLGNVVTQSLLGLGAGGGDVAGGLLGELAGFLKIAYALATIASQSGRGQPHSKTLRNVRHVGERASVLECGCPLPLSPPQEVIVIVRHCTSGSCPARFRERTESSECTPRFAWPARAPNARNYLDTSPSLLESSLALWS